MAVYFKFKSAKDYDSIPMDGPFISVGALKERIFESKLGRGKDYDLVVSNAQTNEEYLDEAMLIPKNTSVLIRRVPGRPRLPIVAAPELMVENMVDISQPERSSLPDADSFMKYTEESEWDEFGNDLYSIPEMVPAQSRNPIPEAPPANKADEDSKIQALIDTPALDWQCQSTDGFGPGRGFVRGIGRRMDGRGFGMASKITPPEGYICHRCKVPGHFIQHCPTNGDPNFDVRRVKPPTGIPKSMLIVNPDGSYALPSGAVGFLKPNEAAFEKEIEGLPTARSVSDLPPELHCPLCKEVMKDAMLTSKCCFASFCDKCIRDFIMSRSVCVCGATHIRADDLLPNKTLRDTINRILESGTSSAENAGSTYQVQDMESARCLQPKIPSPTTSASSKGEQKSFPAFGETMNGTNKVDEAKPAVPLVQTLEKVETTKPTNASEATYGSMSMKEPASQSSAPLPEDEVQQKLAATEAVKKKKKKKVRMPTNDFQWNAPQDLAAENYMMHMGPSGYNPYWNGMQPGMDGFMGPYGGPMPPYMGYGLGPFDMPFGPVMPPDPFCPPNFMFPGIPPQRDLADFGRGMNVGPPPPILSREEFEARKADLRRKRENERRGDSREFSREREFGKEVTSGGDFTSSKPKPKATNPSMVSADHRNGHHRERSERTSGERYSRDLDPPPPRPLKRKSDHDYDDHERDRARHHQRPEASSKPVPEKAVKATSTSATAAADKKHKTSVFSRISFPEGESKKRKLSSEPAASSANQKPASNGHNDDLKPSSSAVPKAVSATTVKKSSSSAVDYESSDDDRHFKRRPSRYEPSPPPVAEREEELRHSRGSRERERSGYSKHR